MNPKSSVHNLRTTFARAEERLGLFIGESRRLACPAAVATVRRNLHYFGLADSDVELEKLTRLTFRSYGRFVVEFFRGLTLSPHQIAGSWKIQGRDQLAGLRTARQGWILACAHTGNWEHLGALALIEGRHVVAPVGVQFHPLVAPLIGRIKRARGAVSLPARHNPRALLRRLAAGDVILLPIDGGEFRRGIRTELRGRPWKMAAGAARLSQRSGRPIVPVMARRTGFMRQSLTICPPLWPVGGRASGREARQACAHLSLRLADLLGAHLEQTRDQWCIFRNLVPGGL